MGQVPNQVPTCPCPLLQRTNDSHHSHRERALILRERHLRSAVEIGCVRSIVPVFQSPDEVIVPSLTVCLAPVLKPAASSKISPRGERENLPATSSGRGARVDVLRILHIRMLNMLRQPVLKEIHDVDRKYRLALRQSFANLLHLFGKRLVLGFMLGQPRIPILRHQNFFAGEMGYRVAHQAVENTRQSRTPLALRHRCIQLAGETKEHLMLRIDALNLY